MKALDEYITARFGSLLTNLERYHRFNEPETLHQIRVDIKKTKCVLQLMDASLKKFDGHELYLPLRNIFRKANQIRQPQLMVHLLIAHGLEGLPIEQFGDSLKHQEEFRAEIPFYLEQLGGTGKEIKSELKRVRSNDVRNHLRKQMKAIRSRLFPKLKPKDLHKVRKRAKSVVYLAKFSDLLSRRKRKFYAILEDAIGRLHDKELLLEVLNTSPTQIDPATVAGLRKTCARDRKAIGSLANEFYD